MPSSNTINGEVIKFTSTSNNPIITLMPENGKTLVLRNASFENDEEETATFPIIDDIEYTSREPDATYDFTNDASDVEEPKQGSSIYLDPTSNVILTGTATSDTFFTSGDAFLGEWNAISTTWILDQKIRKEGSSESQPGFSIQGSVYENTMTLSFGEQGPPLDFPQYIYKHDGLTWNLSQTLSSIQCRRSSLWGNYILFSTSPGGPNAQIWSRPDEASDFAFQQSLGYVASSAKLIDDLAVFTTSGSLKVFTNHSDVWSEVFSYTGPNLFTKCTASDSFIATASSSQIYVFSRSGDTITFLYYLNTSGIQDLKLVNNRLAYITDSTLYVYTLFESVLVLESTTSVSATNLATTLAMNNDFIAVGCPFEDSNNGLVTTYKLEDVIKEYQNQITSTLGSMSIETGTLFVPSTIVSNGTNTGALVVSGGIGCSSVYANTITTSTLNVSSLVATSSTISALQTTNVNINQATVSSLLANSATATNLTATSATSSSLQCTNLHATNSTIGILLATSSVTSPLYYGSEFIRYTSSSNQTIPGITNTRVTATYFDGGPISFLDGTSAGITASDAEFTITRNGIFTISASVMFDSNAAGFRQLFICRNGNTNLRYADLTLPAINGNPMTMHLSTTVIGFVGDVFQIYVYHNVVVPPFLDLLGGAVSGVTRYFSIARICDVN